ncbi:MAG: MarR family transcriptional regulator [Acidobacteriota bacterium]
MSSDSGFPDQPPLVERLLAALERVATAQRVGRAGRAARHGLSRLQADLLLLIDTRADEQPRIGDLAAWLGLTRPTVSEAVGALERKGLVERAADPADRRAVTVRCTSRGAALVADLGTDVDLRDAVESAIPEDDRGRLLGLLLRLIRELQERGQIPVTRMCVSCRFFEPWSHDDAHRPHHCALVDTALGDADLRVECPDWEPAEDARRAVRWLAGRASRR